MAQNFVHKNLLLETIFWWYSKAKVFFALHIIDCIIYNTKNALPLCGYFTLLEKHKSQYLNNKKWLKVFIYFESKSHFIHSYQMMRSTLQQLKIKPLWRHIDKHDGVLLSNFLIGVTLLPGGSNLRWTAIPHINKCEWCDKVCLINIKIKTKEGKEKLASYSYKASL